MDQSLARDTTAASPTDQYERLFRQWLIVSDEATQRAAREFGRELLSSGFGLQDTIAIHHLVLGRVVSERPVTDAPDVTRAAHALLTECLTPFETNQRAAREAHDELRASEERYRELIENANDIIFTTDLDGRFTSINRAGELLTGYTSEEAHTLRLDALMAPEHVQMALAMLELKLGNPDGRTRYEVELIARDGRRIPVEVSTRLVRLRGKRIGIQGIARDITDRRQAEHALRHLNQRLEEKVKSIAHALHDEAGQLLASVYLNVAEIASELPHRGRQRLDELRTLLDQVDDQLRRLSHELRPAILDDLGLLPACEFLAEGVSHRGRLSVIVRGNTGGRLPVDVETALYRVAQEALNNATRHGRAQIVAMEFERQGRLLKGFIRDDGLGFDVPAVLMRTNKQGLGLMGMRERLIAVGGKLTIKSSPGSGTSVEFEVPVEN